MATIKVHTRSVAHFVVVDDQDFSYLSGLTWYSNGTYAYRQVSNAGKRTNVYLHRQVMQRKVDRELRPGEKVDHKNGVPTDCRRENLRLATHSQNLRNSKVPLTSTTGAKGVYWRQDRQNWQVRLKVKGRMVTVGTFLEKEDAIRAYNSAGHQYHGRFARLNAVAEAI